jgi:hypothetical protein
MAWCEGHGSYFGDRLLALLLELAKRLAKELDKEANP